VGLVSIFCADLNGDVDKEADHMVYMIDDHIARAR
jgi:hypothetical protein